MAEVWIRIYEVTPGSGSGWETFSPHCIESYCRTREGRTAAWVPVVKRSSGMEKLPGPQTTDTGRWRGIGARFRPFQRESLQVSRETELPGQLVPPIQIDMGAGLARMVASRAVVGRASVSVTSHVGPTAVTCATDRATVAFSHSLPWWSKASPPPRLLFQRKNMFKNSNIDKDSKGQEVFHSQEKWIPKFLQTQAVHVGYFCLI